MKKLDTSFFKVPVSDAAVAAGSVLIADPFLSEQWFARSVISVIDHNDDEGTTGVVLNNPLATTLDEVLDGIEREEPVKVYCGGPLSQDRLFFVHTLGDEVIPEARQYAPGLWIGGDFDAAIQYVNAGYPIDGVLRFFIGYSGWTAGQLAGEIDEGTWAVQSDSNLIDGLLAGTGDHAWHNAVHTLGDLYRPWLLLPQETQSN